MEKAVVAEMRAKPFPASGALVAGLHEVGVGGQPTTDSEVLAV